MVVFSAGGRYTLGISLGMLCMLSPPASALEVIQKRFIVEGAVRPYGDGQYEYIHPRADALHVSELTSIAIREGEEVIPADLYGLFNVTGQESGLVKGTVVLARDNKTVVFYAGRPFVENEKVTVKFGPGLRVRRSENFTEREAGPYEWSFRIRTKYKAASVPAKFDYLDRESEQPDEQEGLKGPTPMDRYRTLPTWAAKLKPSPEGEKAAVDERNDATGAEGDLYFFGVGHARGEHAGQHIITTRDGVLVWWTHTSTFAAGVLGVAPTGHVAVWDTRPEDTSLKAYELNSTYQAVARHNPGTQMVSSQPWSLAGSSFQAMDID